MKELIKTNSLSSEKNQINIQDNILEFDNYRIDLNSITEMKYGLEPISFYKFYVGRKYKIELKNSDNVKSIILRSYFGLSSKYFHKVFTEILNNIWKYTGVRLVNEAIESLKSGNSVTAGKCLITPEGVTFKNILVNWDNLVYQKNYGRITLTDKSNHKHWTNLYYLEAYNTDVLSHILDWAYKQEGIKELKTSHNIV